jgi:hypothetical protein
VCLSSTTATGKFQRRFGIPSRHEKLKRRRQDDRPRIGISCSQTLCLTGELFRDLINTAAQRIAIELELTVFALGRRCE